jgi:serine/threonine protein kinase
MLQDLGHGEEQVKVIDFGIAKVKDSVIGQTTDTNVAVGTVSYMSPEQLSAKPVSAATDVYALAEIAYEMLCGRKPFNPETGFELLGLQREGVRVNPVDLRPGLPLEAQTAILRALSFDPKDRHSSAREFGDNLAQALTLSEDTSASAPAATVVVTEMTTMPDPSADKRNPNPTIAATIPIIQPTDRLVDGPQTKGNRLSMRLIVVVGLLGLLGVGGTFGAWHLYQKSLINSRNEGPPIGTERHLNFWLTVQKMRDGKPYQDPFDSSGQEIFEDGWKFRMNLSSPESGFLYLLNEGPALEGATTLTLLFPNPFINSGSPQVSSDQQTQTGWMVFDKSQGTENFWLVWSANPIAELEAVKGVVNNVDKGSIKDANQAEAVRKFLSASRPTAETQKDSEKKQTNIKASGNQIVHRIELEHH